MAANPNQVFSEKTADFALDLFRKVVKLDTTSPKTENVVFSPASITVALALTQQGARGKTGEQIGQRLFGNLPAKEAEQSLVQLSKVLNQKQNGFTINSANRLFVDDHFAILDGYLQDSRRLFQAEAENVPFSSDTGKSVVKINEWVSEKTGGKIRKLFEKLSNDTKLVIANAVYFKGDWADQFDESKTGRSDFQVDATKSVQLDFMHAYNQFGFGGNAEMQILSLPYANEQLSMIFILPGEQFGLAKLEKALTGEKLWQWVDKIRKRKVQVSIPKFKIEASLGLAETLKQLGMSEMFSENADLTKISESGGLFVSDVVHKAFLEINEKGAEAAASTGVSIEARSMPPQFSADQPFLFSIIDNRSKTLLFLGHFYGN